MIKKDKEHMISMKLMNFIKQLFPDKMNLQRLYVGTSIFGH